MRKEVVWQYTRPDALDETTFGCTAHGCPVFDQLVTISTLFPRDRFCHTDSFRERKPPPFVNSLEYSIFIGIDQAESLGMLR
jgi:hypothetical protein